MVLCKVGKDTFLHSVKFWGMLDEGEAIYHALHGVQEIVITLTNVRIKLESKPLRTFLKCAYCN